MSNGFLQYYNPAWVVPDGRTLEADVLVYGGNAAGVVAAVELVRRGQKPVLCHPGRHLGGLTSGGLGYTDFGNKKVVGGLAREFYRALGPIYGLPECFSFEPGAAEKIFEHWVREQKIEVIRCAYLKDVTVVGKRISKVQFHGGLVMKAKSFIDTSYEGDLMAKAGVSFVVGRESNREFGETHNGSQIHPTHQFDRSVDPYVIPGKKESGLLPGIEAGPVEEGLGDKKVQAYNFRVCMTDDPGQKVPFPKPEGYNPADYELAARFLAGVKNWRREDPEARPNDRIFNKFDRLTAKHKTDTNNHGPVSTDFIGGSWNWAEGSYEAREVIFQNHVRWQQGLHYFMANDQRVPEDIRTEYSRWGLARDEFADTGHWPHQLYIREARRMRGAVVVSEAVCQGEKTHPDVAGMGAYQMDSHHVRRVVVDGCVKNEGDVQKRVPAPYGIPYLAMIPKEGECENLAVPVCLSATHIAYGSIRMEPVFMVMAQSAAIGVALALGKNQPLLAATGAPLQKALVEAGQVVATDARNDGGGNP